MIVVDTSVVGLLMLPDEAAEFTPAARNRLISTTMIVPMHWHLEIASMFRSAMRRKQISEAECMALLARTARLVVVVDSATAEMAWSRTFDLVIAHGLTPYDAAYLELALRLALPLATRDGDLIKAAMRVGVPLISLSP